MNTETKNREFRVIIAGGRDFNDYDYLKRSIDYFLSRITYKVVVICGAARGADTLGARYAEERGYEIRYYPADWNTYKKSAGFVRNLEMAQNADALVAFWDGKSSGTKHMIETARKYRLLIRIKHYNQKEET